MNPESKNCAVVSISALSVDGKKTFSFDLKLRGDEEFAVKPEHVKAQYAEETGILEIHVQGLMLNGKPEPSPSILDRVKRFFK